MTCSLTAFGVEKDIKKELRHFCRSSFFYNWCPGGDSNSHAIQRYHLKIVCLPIPPPGHRCSSIEKPSLWQAFFAVFAQSRNFFRCCLCICRGTDTKKELRHFCRSSFFHNWCPGGDSNSHAIQRYHLKIVCLPIPPPGHEAELIAIRHGWQAFFCAFPQKNAPAAQARELSPRTA